MKTAQETIHFVSLGCPKNRVDSEVMAGLALNAGYQLTTEPAQAGVIVVNTCSFLAAAEKESIETILELARYKSQGACALLVVAGCLPQRHAADLPRLLPEVDFFLGTGEMPRLMDILAGRRRQRSLIGPPGYLPTSRTPRLNSMPRHLAYLKIAEGCSHRCTFCIIPKIRGPQRSRPVADLVREAHNLADTGVRELVLVAQDTTAYGRDLPGQPTLSDLLERLAIIDALHWLRILYGHPDKISTRLLKLMAREPKLVPYLDLPLQHVSDGIMARMRRGRSGQRARKLMARLRAEVPGIAVRTTLIVGFPGETERDFRELHDFVAETRFERLGVFPFSPEAGTKAARLPGRVPEKVRLARQREIMTLQRKISRQLNRALVGQRVEVVIDGAAPGARSFYSGRMATQAPEIDGLVYVEGGTARPGEFVSAEITKAGDYDLYGKIIR